MWCRADPSVDTDASKSSHMTRDTNNFPIMVGDTPIIFLLSLWHGFDSLDIEKKHMQKEREREKRETEKERERE